MPRPDYRDITLDQLVQLLEARDPKNRIPMTVRYNPRKDKNELDAVFRCEAMPTY